MNFDYTDILKAETAILASGLGLFLGATNIDMGYAKYQGAERTMVNLWMALNIPFIATGFLYPFSNLLRLSARFKAVKRLLIQLGVELFSLFLIFMFLIRFAPWRVGGSAISRLVPFAAAAGLGVAAVALLHSIRKNWKIDDPNLFVKLTGLFMVVFISSAVSASAAQDLIVGVGGSRMTGERIECLELKEVKCEAKNTETVEIPDRCSEHLETTSKLEKQGEARIYTRCDPNGGG